jgi:hypothetical protein
MQFKPIFTMDYVDSWYEASNMSYPDHLDDLKTPWTLVENNAFH